jgi:hypothetical protein
MPSVVEWVALDDANEFDPPANGLTEIRPGGPLEGALFVERRRAKNRHLKLPPIEYVSGNNLGKYPEGLLEQRAGVDLP